jgi:hypothetical protein
MPAYYEVVSFSDLPPCSGLHSWTSSKLCISWVSSNHYPSFCLYRIVVITVNQNCTHEEIKSKLNLGNVWYHSVQKHSFSCLSKRIKAEISKTIFCLSINGGVGYLWPALLAHWPNTARGGPAWFLLATLQPIPSCYIWVTWSHPYAFCAAARHSSMWLMQLARSRRHT